MKRAILYVTILSVLISCKNNDDSDNVDSDIVGTWALIENLADPGDGSGTFQTVESNKLITFVNDGSVFSNGSICDISITTDNATTGTYSTNDSTIHSDDCINFVGLDISYVIEGEHLIISYPCIEPCQSKFISIQE